jgi:hypothetical protein
VYFPYDAGVVALAGNLALVAGWDRGVFAINISNLTSPQIHGSVNTPDHARGVALSGNRAYLANWYSGLQVIDISNSKSPRITGTANTPGIAWAVTVAGDRAYVADWHKGLQIIDISVSTSPQLDGSVDTPGYAQGIAVAGTKAYVADGEFGLQIIDISDTKNPGIVGSVNTPDDAQGVTVAGTKAYVADRGSGLQIIDVNNPTSPRIVGSVDTPGDAQGVVVAGKMAYVADGYHSFQIIDVSNPTSPRIVSSVDIPGYAWGVTVAGDRAYVAGGSGGNLVIDISNPTRPQIIGAVDTPGHAIETRVLGDKVYIADDFYGLVIVPLPVEIVSPVVVSENRISAALPSPITAGYYTLMIFNENESEELVGAVTFSSSDDYQQLALKKAIIVAGYRSYPVDSLWDKTKRCANMAYLSLLTQGYKSENIYYLSPEPVDIDGDGQNDVDAAVNLQNLSYAIRTWARGTPELLLYITDHGGSGTFQLNDSQILDAITLDGWLDEAQSSISERVIFVYDACKSGSFLELLTPPSGKERIVIASTTADEYAWFEQNGVLSFSYQFWAYAMVDGYLSRAFNSAANMMKTDQSALLDANGNGVANEKADDISDIVIGRGRVAAAVPPFVGHVSGKQILAGETSASFWARNVGGLNPVVQVWAVIIPPGDRPADNPIIDFPKVDLLDADRDGTYEASYSGFTSVGTYRVMVYAKDEDGAISLPKEIAVSQTAADSYEDDDTFRKANAIVLNDPNSQLHNFHDASDEDWVKFYELAGETYSIEAYNLGENCDAVIELYASDGTTLLDFQDTIGDPNADELLEWSCNRDDIYHAKIKHYASSVFGDGTEYDLKAYRSIAPLAGFVVGIVTDEVSGQAIADVKIRSDKKASALSLYDGSYVLVHQQGTFTVTAQAEGYIAKSYSGVQVGEGDITTRDIVLVPSAPDTDKDGIPDSVENASYCLNPYDADTDNDRLLDGEEDINCDGIIDPGESNPCDRDTDDDQMPDGWEVEYNLNPLVDDASQDADGDGYSNLEEYRGGSDPTDRNSLPKPKSMPWIPLLLFEKE